MIAVITVDYAGLPGTILNESDQDVTVAGGDVITMNPGVPKINTPEFDAWLRAWHAEHNQPLTATCIIPEIVHDRT